MCQEKNYGDGGIFCSFFKTSKLDWCLTFKKYEDVEKKRSLKGFVDGNRILEPKKYSDLLEAKPISGKFQKSSFSSIKKWKIEGCRESFNRDV